MEGESSASCLSRNVILRVIDNDRQRLSFESTFHEYMELVRAITHVMK